MNAPAKVIPLRPLREALPASLKLVPQPEFVTSYWPKPIPDSDFDWQAMRAGYEPGDPIGWGATEEEAIAALLREEEERREDTVAPPLFPRTPSEDELEDERADWGGDL